MYREVSHTADEAYEIIFSDENELFGDIVDIIKKKVDGKITNENRIELYELGEDLMDSVFDIANDMIYMVDRGWVPYEAKVEKNGLKVLYRRAEVEKFDFKALTYHMKLEDNENTKILKVVFDV